MTEPPSPPPASALRRPLPPRGRCCEAERPSERGRRGFLFRDSPVDGTTVMCHHAWLIFECFVETGFRHVAQAVYKLTFLNVLYQKPQTVKSRPEPSLTLN
ncbi:hypothetical protein AAY473_001671, partial [Plecturocebus cupreus]